MGRNFDITDAQIPYLDSFNATHQTSKGMDPIRPYGGYPVNRLAYGDVSDIAAFAEYTNTQLSSMIHTNYVKPNYIITEPTLAMQIAASQSQVAADILKKTNYDTNRTTSAYNLPTSAQIIANNGSWDTTPSLITSSNGSMLPLIIIGATLFLTMRKH